MATQLFLLDTVADTHLGTDNTNLLGTAVGWTSKALGLARGSGVIASDNVATVAGTTTGIVITKTSPVEWISPPLVSDVTISGTITLNIWATESNAAANVAINAVIDVIRANATATRNSNTIVEIARSTRVTEVSTTGVRAVNNFTVTPTSTVVNRGDRLRVRIYGDDAVTMGSGRTFNVSWAGTTAAVDGDTYLSFTNDFLFEQAPGLIGTDTSIEAGSSNVGRATVPNEAAAQSFVAPGATLSEVKARLQKVGTPTDNLDLTIESDASGLPSGSVVGTVGSVAGTTLTTSMVAYTFSGLSIALTAGATYWVVLRRSSTLSDTNYYRASAYAVATTPGARYTGGAWADAGASTLNLSVTVSTEGLPVLYLTDTASDVATASVDREAWTSRGAGVQTDVRNTAAGWTAPLQLTDTAGGTVVDWFTKQLTAFTLTGMAVANIRALESNASANASVRCEVARVDSDGTNATVWASWCIAPTSTDNGELTTSEVARTANVSGDDLAFTNGQRIRIRLYVDDISSAAMATAFTQTVYYAGTSAAASGDTYIRLPQSVSEYVTATAGSAMQTMRQRRAQRFLTNR